MFVCAPDLYAGLTANPKNPFRGQRMFGRAGLPTHKETSWVSNVRCRCFSVVQCSKFQLAGDI